MRRGGIWKDRKRRRSRRRKRRSKKEEIEKEGRGFGGETDEMLRELEEEEAGRRAGG